MLVSTLWDSLFKWFTDMVTNFSKVLDFISKPLTQLVSSNTSGVISTFLNNILHLTGISNFTIGEFLFGAALPIFLLIAILKFFLDIIK